MILSPGSLGVSWGGVTPNFDDQRKGSVVMVMILSSPLVRTEPAGLGERISYGSASLMLNARTGQCQWRKPDGRSGSYGQVICHPVTGLAPSRSDEVENAVDG